MKIPSDVRAFGSKLVTRSDVAAFLSVHPRTVSRMVERGELPSPLPLRAASPGRRPELRWKGWDVLEWVGSLS